MMESAAAWPTEIALNNNGRTVLMTFDDGKSFEMPAEYLRVMSPSAEVQGHSRHDRKIVGGKRNVAIVGADPVGSYAVRFSFDDMHSTGLFTWTYLHELGLQQEERWNSYLTDLAANGLDRDKPGQASLA